MGTFDFLDRMRQGAEAGWEGVKETVRSGNVFKGGQAVQDYLNGTESEKFKSDDEE